jgi:hypothetical protein
MSDYLKIAMILTQWTNIFILLTMLFRKNQRKRNPMKIQPRKRKKKEKMKKKKCLKSKKWKKNLKATCFSLKNSKNVYRYIFF